MQMHESRLYDNSLRMNKQSDASHQKHSNKIHKSYKCITMQSRVITWDPPVLAHRLIPNTIINLSMSITSKTLIKQRN